MSTQQPLISGFTFIKNGLTLGYPIRESIESIEPLCDEVVINVGFDDPNLVEDDGTYEYLRQHFTHPKFKFLKNWWDPSLKKEGRILSQQTNLALEACTGKYCQYIQGDEALHQDDLSLIHDQVLELENQPEIDGLIFNYLHFYGSVDFIKYTRTIYRREVRLIRNGKGIKSWLDAQGFRLSDDTKMQAKLISARVFHYGWARQEQIMDTKIQKFSELYHGDSYQHQKFEYKKIWGLKKYIGTHPQVMKKWIEENRNDICFENLPRSPFRFKDIGLYIGDKIESVTNYRIGEYKNYRMVK